MGVFFEDKDGGSKGRGKDVFCEWGICRCTDFLILTSMKQRGCIRVCRGLVYSVICYLFVQVLNYRSLSVGDIEIIQGWFWKFGKCRGFRQLDLYGEVRRSGRFVLGWGRGGKGQRGGEFKANCEVSWVFICQVVGVVFLGLQS